MIITIKCKLFYYINNLTFLFITSNITSVYITIIFPQNLSDNLLLFQIFK
jgi:hypothetical protein